MSSGDVESSFPKNSIPEKYLLIEDLLNNPGRDPPDDPYRSKYEARKLLLDLVEALSDDSPGEDNDRLAIVYYLLANISYDVEEPSLGYEYASKSLNIVSHDPLNPGKIICYVSVMNVLGYAACKYERIEESLELLLKAEEAYKSYKELHETLPTEFSTAFTGSVVGRETGLEKVYTSTLFYLAQVYSAKGDRFKSAKYCHTTLERQLNLKDLDVIDWALNSATLSQYLIEKYAFRQARNHLALAQILLEKHSKALVKDDSSEEVQAMFERYKHRLADVYRCWAKYGLYLLTASKERLTTSEGDTLDPPPPLPEELEGLIFTGTGEDNLSECESSITSDYLLTYEEAKPVFLISQEWLKKAKDYYTLDEHATDHVSILQDSSQLYLLLSFFQSDESIQCKLQKRRADLLESVADSLNPKYYLATCRELWQELGGIYLAMADIKGFQGEETKDARLKEKSQLLYSKGINYYEKYLETFHLTNRTKRVPESDERSVILAYMCLGRMYSKLNPPEKAQLMRFQASSLASYRTVLDYANSNEELKGILPEEISICKEMVHLIPLKISKIQRYV